jgi:hypothetical protein
MPIGVCREGGRVFLSLPGLAIWQWAQHPALGCQTGSMALYPQLNPEASGNAPLVCLEVHP